MYNAVYPPHREFLKELYFINTILPAWTKGWNEADRNQVYFDFWKELI